MSTLSCDVGITFILIVLAIGTRQEEEGEEEVMLVMIKMEEEEDVVPRLPRINPVPLWRLGNTSTWWIPILLLKSMIPPGSFIIDACVQ